MTESRNKDILTVKNHTSERLNIESKEPPEEISDKKEDDKEIKYDKKILKKSAQRKRSILTFLKMK